MKPAAFEYVRPRDVAEATEILARSEGARVLAGGQSLGPMLNLRLARPELLVDISGLKELAGFEETDATWRIGAGVTHARLEDTEALRGSAPMIIEVASDIAYRSVRNRGTIGGSLAHADPAADWPLALAALGAWIHVRGHRGSCRRVDGDSFMRAAFTTELRQDEIIVFIEVPKQASTASHGYFKFCRKAGEFPEASAAVLIDPDAMQVRIFIGALDGAPRPLPDLAEAVAARGPDAATEDALHAAIECATAGLDAIDIRMRAAVVERAIRKAFHQ